MRLLLDTHIIIWQITNDNSLTQNAVKIITDPDNYISVSTISVWEIAIKSNARKRDTERPLLSGAAFLNELSRAGITPMPILPAQMLLVETLPLLHRDPFDRALIAQAKHEGMTLLTHDKKLADYGDFVMVV